MYPALVRKRQGSDRVIETTAGPQLFPANAPPRDSYQAMRSEEQQQYRIPPALRYICVGCGFSRTFSWTFFYRAFHTDRTASFLQAGISISECLEAHAGLQLIAFSLNGLGLNLFLR